MSLLRIVQFPHPVLRQRAGPVDGMNSELERLVADMVETMYHAPGVGIAANQVAVPVQIAVIDVSRPEEPQNPLVLLNPKIIELSKETEKAEEKCLSVPDFQSEVERALKIAVLARDLKGQEIKITAEGFMARVLQHEIDHLNGTLYIDRIGRLKRQRYVRQRKKALADLALE